MTLEVDDDVAELHAPRIAAGERRPPEERLDPCHQLGGREGLPDVVVRAKLQAEDEIVFAAASGQHQHRQPGRHLAQRAAHVVAIALRQHHVEQHEVRRARQSRLVARFAVAGEDDLVAARLEVVLQAARHVGLVFDDENPRHDYARTGPGLAGTDIAAACPAASGSTSVNTVPSPGVL